jgi:hypothetical protein
MPTEAKYSPAHLNGIVVRENDTAVRVRSGWWVAGHRDTIDSWRIPRGEGVEFEEEAALLRLGHGDLRVDRVHGPRFDPNAGWRLATSGSSGRRERQEGERDETCQR